MYSSGGLIKPLGGKLGIVSRILDGVLVFTALQICLNAYGVEMSDPYWFAVGWAVILFLLIAESRSLYHSWRIAPLHQEIVQIVLAWLTVFALLVVLAFSTKTSVIYSRLVIFSWALLSPMMMVALRLVVRWVLREMRKHGRNTRTLAIAGLSASTQRLVAQIQNAPWLGFRIVGIYDDTGDVRLLPAGMPLRGDLSTMVAEVHANDIDFVYVTLPMHEEKRIVKLIDALADTTASVYVIPDFFVFDLLHARWFNLGGLPMVSVFESPFHGVDGWLKRLEDLVLASCILLLIFPLMLLIALAVKLTSPGPVIFRQRRYGLNGQIVEVWKFRSMTVCEDGEHIAQAKRDDARITPLGAFLRRTSLDELPQFINVLQGGMSVVGPRPHAIAHNEQYRSLIHGYMLRHKVKPGITGLAQVSGLRGETPTLDKMQARIDHDLNYVRNWSLKLDLRIMLKTIWIVVRGDGQAY